MRTKVRSEVHAESAEVQDGSAEMGGSTTLQTCGHLCACVYVRLHACVHHASVYTRVRVTPAF